MKNDKTKTYSDSNKTTVYGDAEKLTKETVHNIKAGDNIILNNKEYKILEIISESTGEAVIYKIEDAVQKILALKLYYEFINAENEPNTEALTRIKAIDDEDILNLIDYGTGINKYKGKYCFEILDFAHGLDLLDVKKLKEKYKPDFIEKKVIPQILKGILKLHENRIYHCDLKPQNVFYLDKTQVEIVVGDYGSAKTFEFDAEKKSRKTTTVKGTDFYLPPEQARGFISEKNDYYSFGMILLHLFYPEKILLNENSLSHDNGKPKSLSHSKLKQIIERQFEAKPIIDYNPKYERINKLIEGLTLVDFNLRWGENEVKDWLESKNVDVFYKKEVTKIDTKKYSEKTLIFGNYKINSVYDLRDYIINEKNCYADLIEDEDNREDFTDWFLNLYDGDRSKRSAFNRIVKLYSQEGIDFVADAVIRFFIPEHLVSIGLKSFNFAESNDILKPVALAFSHLIFDLWDNSIEKDIKLFIFSFEFALRHTKNKEEADRILRILYQKLSVNENAENDFEDYKVHAYTKINKSSLKAVKEFLTELSAGDIEIEVNSIDKENNLHYNAIKSTSTYFQSIGIDNILSYKFSENQIIALKCPDFSESFDDFTEKTFINFIEDFVNKHNIINDISPASVKKIKEILKTTYRNIIDNIENELSSLKKEFSEEIRIFSGFSTDFNVVNNYMQNIKYDKAQQTYEDILLLKSELEKVVEVKDNLNQYRNNAKESSLVMPLLKEAEKLIKTNNYKEAEKARQILTKEHSFEFETLFDVRNIKKHIEISYEEVNWFKIIEVDSFIGSMAMSPNGKYIVAGANLNEILMIINLNLKKTEFIFENLKYSPKSITVSNDGKKIACTGTYDKRTMVYDPYSRKKIRTLKKFRHYASYAVFSPDARYLAVTGYENTLFWNLETWKVEKIIDASKPVCFHPCENFLAFGNYNYEIVLIDLNTKESFIISDEHPGQLQELCFSPDGKLIASCCHDHIVRIWDVKTAKLIHSFSGHAQYLESSICFSPDGKLLATVLNSGEVRFWSVTDGIPLMTITNIENAKRLAFHPSGDYIAIASQNQVFLIYLKHSALHTYKMNIPDFIIYEKKQSQESKEFKNEPEKKDSKGIDEKN